MESESIWDRFTNIYSLTKTLRFELKPVWKTLENIENKGLIDQDEKRAKSYKEMKNTIDCFHEEFINQTMSHVRLTKLENFANLYNASAERKKDAHFKKEFEKVQEDLRKEIASSFKAGQATGRYSKLFKKELFTELLEQIPKGKTINDLGKWNEKSSDEKKNFVFFDEEFKKFTTYFREFQENRKNMYTEKKQSTAIAYRVIHENLPIFLDNIEIFKTIKSIPELYQKCAKLYKEIKEYADIESIEKAFELDYYNIVLTQKNIDAYNMIIGGRPAQNGKDKIQGLNEYINYYNQEHSTKNIPRFKQLYKQILSDKEEHSFLYEAFEDDNLKSASKKVLESIKEYYNKNLIYFRPDNNSDAKNVFEELKELLSNLKNYDTEKIYIYNNAVTKISKELFDDWHVINDALEFSFLKTLRIGKKGLSKKQENQKEKYLKEQPHSIKEIEKALFDYKNEVEIPGISQKDIIVDYFSTSLTKKNLIQNIKTKFDLIKDVLEEYPNENQLNQDKKTIGNIKAFLDDLMVLLHFVKPLSLPSDSTLEKDQVFYNQFQVWYGQLQLLVPLYNKVRDYATQKPYSVKKFKLNFENSTFLAGWDVNKEKDNTAILLKKDEDYFLGVMDKGYNDIFNFIPAPESNDTFEKVNYKLLPGANKMLPKVFFSKKYRKFYAPSEEILRIREHSSYTKNGKPQEGAIKFEFNKEDCHKMISFFKECIQKHPEWKNFGFKFQDTDKYGSINEFYKEVEKQGYSISYTRIDTKLLKDYVNAGKLYLFQIYNKDFSKHSKGKPNLHTMYWKALFDPKNLKDVVYKLNGEAEMFYRRKSICKPTIHKANEPIPKKNSTIKNRKSVFNYDLVKDKRYTVDKFQFHVPITLNFKAEKNADINNDVLNVFKNNPNLNIIGLDRGERNLIYLTLINQDGSILEQKSLNTTINDKFNIKTDYHKLLDDREKERAAARKEWETIKTIKELKEGYIGTVIYEISRMMIKHNAIIVMEDLNFGFKRGRFKVEKQVYQKLEKRLIDKLNYLVFKMTEDEKIGGLYKALQLTNKFESFRNLGKQSGFLFYVPAWYTSSIDPTTGFVNMFNTKYKNVEETKSFFKKFKSISYNKDKDYFEFEVEKYSSFNPKVGATKQEWVICTNGDRIKTFRNEQGQWNNKKIILSDEFKNLFDKYGIKYESELKNKIQSQTRKEFFEELLNLFKYTVQMRNSIANHETDYIISPVLNAEDKFYDSRNAGANLPKDADANGAYNIARKGLWILKQINAHNESWEKQKLNISIEEWLRFAQSSEINGRKYNNIKP